MTDISERRRVLLAEAEVFQAQLKAIYGELDKLKTECKHEKPAERHISSCCGHRRIWTTCPDCNKELSERYLDPDENEDDPPRVYKEEDDGY
jgi:hypothetical protein